MTARFTASLMETIKSPAAEVSSLQRMSSKVTLASLAVTQRFGRFSNRPVGVKRFQTIHHHSIDVSRGLALLFGIGTKALVWGFLSQEVYARL